MLFPILLPKSNFTESVISANQRRCIYCEAEKSRVNTTVRKHGVIKYLENRKVFPECYSAPTGWYKGGYTVKMKNEVPKYVLENMKLYYTELFAKYPDVITTTEISKVIGYSTTAINNWCNNGHLKSFKKRNVNHIPKIYLIEFFCSKYFRTITRKSEWHIWVLKEFPRWQVIKGLKTKE